MSTVAYKESGIRWLGRVPLEWDVAKIKRHCLVKRGASPRPIDDPKYFSEEGEYSWVRISDVTASDRYLTTTDQRLSEYGASLSVKREPGDIFVSICASVGKPIITEIRCCIHDGFVCFDRLKLDKEYLFYLFTSGEMFKGLGNWGTQLNLNTEIIGDIIIPVPPTHQQRRIAAYLDEQTAKIDRLMALRRRQMELLKEQRVAIIQQAVTRGLNPDVPMKNPGIPWMGKIPKHWEVTQLRRIIKSGTSITYGIVQAGHHIEGGIPYIRTSDMSGDALPLEGYLCTTPEIDHSYRRSKVCAGDVVVAIRATIGKPLPVPPELEGANLTQGTAKVSPGKRISTQFLVVALKSESARQQFGSLAKGTTFLEITLDMLRRFVIPLPPDDEQKEIVAFIENETAKHDSLYSAYVRQLTLLAEYRASLIHECVTGQRVAPDLQQPIEETAHAL